MRSLLRHLLGALLGVVLLVKALEEEGTQVDDSYAALFPTLAAEHFTVHLPALIEKGELTAQTLFSSRPVLSVSDANRNAASLRTLVQAVSEDQAYQKLTKLKLFLVAQKQVANTTQLKRLHEFSEKQLLISLFANAKLDLYSSDLAVGPVGRELRALLLGVNALLVYAHNGKSRHSKQTLNHLSVFDPAELKNFKGFIFDPSKRNRTAPVSVLALQIKSKLQALPQQSQPQQALPASIDWTDQDMVGPILNQGSCGGCWSFAAAAVLESRMAIAKGKLTSLSEQQLISCAITNGCAGGNYETAWEYAQVSGLASSELYPYVSATGSNPACDVTDTQSPVATAPVPVPVVPPNTEEEIMQALVSGGPVAIAISTPACFNSYSSGVLTSEECTCGAANIDHAVVIVGYGTSSEGIPFFKVKNSWGVGWGQAGYILLERGVQPMGMCGLLVDPNYPPQTAWSTECSSASPPAYCKNALQPLLYTNINTTTMQPLATCEASYAGEFPDGTCTGGAAEIPTWGWVLIGIASAFGLVLLIFLLSLCIERFAPADAWYNVFSKPKSDGYQLLSKEDIAAGQRAPVPNSDPRAFRSPVPDSPSEDAVLANT